MPYAVEYYQKGGLKDTPQGKIRTKGWEPAYTGAKTEQEAKQWLKLNPYEESTRIVYYESDYRTPQYEEWGGRGSSQAHERRLQQQAIEKAQKGEALSPAEKRTVKISKDEHFLNGTKIQARDTGGGRVGLYVNIDDYESIKGSIPQPRTNIERRNIYYDSPTEYTTKQDFQQSLLTRQGYDVTRSDNELRAVMPQKEVIISGDTALTVSGRVSDVGFDPYLKDKLGSGKMTSLGKLWSYPNVIDREGGGKLWTTPGKIAGTIGMAGEFVVSNFMEGNINIFRQSMEGPIFADDKTKTFLPISRIASKIATTQENLIQYSYNLGVNLRKEDFTTLNDKPFWNRPQKIAKGIIGTTESIGGYLFQKGKEGSKAIFNEPEIVGLGTAGAIGVYKLGKTTLTEYRKEPLKTATETIIIGAGVSKGLKIVSKPFQNLYVRVNPKGVIYDETGVQIQPGVTIPTRLGTLRQFEGKSVPVAHSTFSQELKVGSLIEPSSWESVGPFRQSIGQRNFYTSSPIKADIEVLVGGRYDTTRKFIKTSYRKTPLKPQYKPVVYGGYIGIGEDYSAGTQTIYSLFPESPQAFIFRDTLISKTPRNIASKNIKTVVEYQSKTAGTFIPAENIKGKSIEGQFTTSAGIEGKPLMKIGEGVGPLNNKFTYYNLKKPVPKILGGEQAQEPIKSVWNALTSENVKVKFKEVKFQQIGKSFYKKGKKSNKIGGLNSPRVIKKSILKEYGTRLKPVSSSSSKKISLSSLSRSSISSSISSSSKKLLSSSISKSKSSSSISRSISSFSSLSRSLSSSSSSRSSISSSISSSLSSSSSSRSSSSSSITTPPGTSINMYSDLGKYIKKPTKKKTYNRLYRGTPSLSVVLGGGGIKLTAAQRKGKALINPYMPRAL